MAILKADNSTPTSYLTTRTYYDKEYSVIQINKQNHLSGADITSNGYDFANRLVKSRRDHTATPPGGTLKSYTIREEYVYDFASRLRFTRHKINANNWVVISAPTYDELDRLGDKRLHASNYDGTSAITLYSTFNYLQSLDYTYNIRGWMTGINDVTSCSIQSGDQLADMFKLQLNYDSPVGGGTAQYNGNISTMHWGTYINSTCLPQQQYRFTYDAADRLTGGDHYTNTSGTWTFTNNYTESNIGYDLNGNIKTYTRRGLTTAPSTFGTIDQLTYYFDDATRPDLLTRVVDAGSATKGFKYLSSASSPHYTYDSNGNLTLDKHKDLTYTYNYLNLPKSATTSSSTGITFTYTADGEKLSKVLTTGVQINYVAGIEYNGANLEAIYHAEGRCTPNGATAFNYQYTLKDNLGNARVNFQANGSAVSYLEDFHYYPFGMTMEGIGSTAAVSYKYRYNGKELNEDFGLNLYNYGARWYDPTVGRWSNVDPFTEQKSWVAPYSYVQNNPITRIDPNGALDTKFTDEDGVPLYENNDGHNGTIVISNNKVDQFKSAVSALGNPGIFGDQSKEVQNTINLFNSFGANDQTLATTTSDDGSQKILGLGGTPALIRTHQIGIRGTLAGGIGIGGTLAAGVAFDSKGNMGVYGSAGIVNGFSVGLGGEYTASWSTDPNFSIASLRGGGTTINVSYEWADLTIGGRGININGNFEDHSIFTYRSSGFGASAGTPLGLSRTLEFTAVHVFGKESIPNNSNMAKSKP